MKLFVCDECKNKTTASLKEEWELWSLWMESKGEDSRVRMLELHFCSKKCSSDFLRETLETHNLKG